MSISKKQWAAMAAIVLGGALAVAAVLLPAGHEDHDHANPEQAEGHAESRLVKLTDAQAAEAGIRVARAGPGVLRPSSEFPGEIRFNEDRTAHVVPRVAGVVEAVPVDLGQQVRKGQVLAVMASTALSDLRSELHSARKRLELAEQTYEREARLWRERVSAEQDYLQARAAREEARIAAQNAAQKLRAIGADEAAPALNQYALRAPFDGTVVEKHMSLGEAMSDTATVFTIADMGTVWAEFIVAPQDLAAVRVGERVTISSSALNETAQGEVSYVGPLLGAQTRTATARVILRNPRMAWRPGLFITVRVLRPEEAVAVAVPASALQAMGEHRVVFAAVPGGFEAREVRTGRRDAEYVEVLEGLEPGTGYAQTNTFLLKAELGKAAVEHNH
ncbi:Cobalt-zinc-cadmium resistance protein CzcB [Pigmentiphaga humi]|uniref:Cobalt-zinc-cadmium resistance protein CzcB n=1 Tax=Pigmentiphaga humi TaxID=2478468 RepID=A0A3P4AYJ4_9BURK|nr:efflux RND transporter periplasmic adaptor subunit [Pigmentiphaga humi]VCU69113.1 Cobalt-zinc-cadmium resistance protein CzcB [Pigmentiphaga humi]